MSHPVTSILFRVCACSIRPMWVETAFSCEIMCLTGRGVLPVPALGCITVYDLWSWAILFAASAVLSLWCLVLDLQDRNGQASSMGSKESCWHPAGNSLNPSISHGMASHDLGSTRQVDSNTSLSSLQAFAKASPGSSLNASRSSCLYCAHLLRK